MPAAPWPGTSGLWLAVVVWQATMLGWRAAVAVAVFHVSAVRAEDGCIGEYQHCPGTGECTLFACDGDGPHCGRGEYRCPVSNHCVKGAAAVASCPGLTGTHLDHTLPLEKRLDYLEQHVNISVAAWQLTNKAPPIERLGIPGYNWLSDDEHGVRGWRTTYFPDGPGLGASFDKSLLHAVGAVVGLEARAQHNYVVSTEGLRQDAFNGAGVTVYGPNMNLVRDPRWGRAQEVYAEDPRLSSALTVGYVTGIQGAAYNATPDDLVYSQAAACCKHYVSYDVEGGGSGLPTRQFFDANVTTRSFWEQYMPVFHDCVVTARAGHVMCSYNSMNGVPTCGDPNLLDGVLRRQWGWPGWVVSDYDAWHNIYSTHHYVPDLEHAAAEGINAGLDQEGGGTAAVDLLPAAVESGLTNTSRVYAAFRRLMRARIKLGMFDPPSLSRYSTLGHADLRTEASTRLNRLAAAKGMVLLQNNKHRDGRALLPVSASSLKGTTGSVLVAGPNAANGNNTFGNYACDSGNCSTKVTSILGGLRYADTGLDGGEVVFEPGCSTTNCSETDFSAAVAAARRAKLVVVVLGTLGWDRLDAGANPSPQAWEREGHDRESIALAGNQYKLVEALAAACDAPVVCVLIHGGSLALGSLTEHCTAIVDAFFPGQQGGAGFADVLLGKVNPAGRSPVTYYKDDGELPPLGNMDMYAGQGTTYRYYRGKPVVPFGFGLSYTTFSYAHLRVSSSRIGPCNTVDVTVDVTNTGAVDGEEVVQAYVTTPGASVPAPLVRLADFERVAIPAGGTVAVTLSVTPKYHCVVTDDSAERFWEPGIAVEAGEFEVHVGGGQPRFADTLSAPVTVTHSSPLTTQYRC